MKEEFNVDSKAEGSA